MLGEGESGGGGTGPTLAYPAYVGREYVYVPSAAGGYVDEFIGQFDRYGDLWWILQDANSNVLAMTDVDGEVVRQTLYDPYGEVLFAEDYSAHPGLKIGHQGLFFDRLEPPAPVSGGTVVSMGAAAQLTPGVFGRYHTNNRSYLPRYGRWAQKDPNASGMLHAALWHDGEAPIPALAAGSLDGVLVDGSNLFAFVGNSPYNATDPMGQSAFAIGIGSIFQGMTLHGELQATEAKTKAKAAATATMPLLLADASTQAMALGLVIGAGSQAVASLWEKLLLDLGVYYAVSSNGLTSAMIAARMGPDQFNAFGDPDDWKYDREKQGSRRPGRLPGDVKYYEIWINEFNRRLDVHYFKNAAGVIKQETVELMGYFDGRG